MMNPENVPVIVYQMGKVGSTSICTSLGEHGVAPLYKVHLMNPDSIRELLEVLPQGTPEPPHLHNGRMVRQEILIPQKPARFITLVRDPVARNVSTFFQIFERMTGRPFVRSALSTEELAELFMARLPHSMPLTWFDTEIGEMLRIDVYAHAFPHEVGFVSISQGANRLLILKCELDDAAKAEAIADFLGLDSFRIKRRNVGRQKDYAEAYGRLRESVRLPDSYLERMYSSRYAGHFYTEQEIERFRAFWSDPARNIHVAADLPEHVSAV